jgi:hypothetical protein
MRYKMEKYDGISRRGLLKGVGVALGLSALGGLEAGCKLGYNATDAIRKHYKAKEGIDCVGVGRMPEIKESGRRPIDARFKGANLASRDYLINCVDGEVREVVADGQTFLLKYNPVGVEGLEFDVKEDHVVAKPGSKYKVTWDLAPGQDKIFKNMEAAINREESKKSSIEKIKDFIESSF